MRLNDILRLVTPPMFIHMARWLRGHRSAYGLSGDYYSWDEAVAASTGYDSHIILEKTKAALLKVKNGEAAYERDSVLFDEIEYAWPLLAGLMWVAARSSGTLNVLDFGGSLGSTYFQNQVFLSTLPEVRWNVVEQARHVEIGKACFADDHLRFYADIASCLADTRPNVVVLGSVLQYLEHPYAVLDQILELPCDHIIVDRTPFWSVSTDRLCVQTVPPSIYPASYPSWILSRQRFRSRLDEHWQILAEVDDPNGLTGSVGVSYKGLILVRRSQLS